MVTECRPLRESGGLPPRRSELIQAAAAEPVASRQDWGNSINVPLARDRMFEHFEREQLPGDVRSTLAAALNGDLHLQAMLFNAMLDTWPKLQKNIAEVARLVSVAPWAVQPYARRGTKPDATAETLAREVEDMIWGMKPREAYGEKAIEGTIRSLVIGYYYGHTVSEIRWKKSADGQWMPRCTKDVPARYYGYSYGTFGSADADPEDRLMYDPAGNLGARQLVDFEDHRFLVGIHRGHEAHAAVAAPLRALTGYWLAAIYGLKWFLNFTQLYGIPWRHAEVGDVKDENAVKAALASIGSTGYLTTKPGTKINILSPAATSGTDLPQKALLDLADAQCDQFILGQTLTSGTGHSGSGSRALGEVHQGTLESVVDGVAEYVGSIISQQLIPSIIALNWGEDHGGMPSFSAKREETTDEKMLAERDVALGITTGETPVSKAWFYERHGLTLPVTGEELLFQSVPHGAPGDPATGSPASAGGFPIETKAGAGNIVNAADASQPLTVDQLSTSVLEGLTGVSTQWLSPVKPFFDRLAALAMSQHVTDEDFLAALEKAQTQLPEIFDLMDTQALEEAFKNAISSAALAGSVSRHERKPVLASFNPNQPRNPHGQDGGRWVKEAMSDGNKNNGYHPVNSAVTLDDAVSLFSHGKMELNVVGVRSGDVPSSGKSFNQISQTSEEGVSTADILGFGDGAGYLDHQRPVVYVRGSVLPEVGGDSEFLLKNTVPISKDDYERTLSNQESSNARAILSKWRAKELTALEKDGWNLGDQPAKWRDRALKFDSIKSEPP